MFHTKFFRSILLIVLLAAAAFPEVTPATAASAAHGVHIFPIGHPTWRPMDFHLFSALIGTADSGYTEFGETQQAILPPPNHLPHPDLGIGPGAPHQPPYDQEFANGLASLGFHQGVRFTRAEFSEGMGVWVVWMVVPAPGTTGSSPDFPSGPVIPNSLFPIHVKAITNHLGKPFNPYTAEFDVPPLDQSLNPPFSVDGHSHFPIFIADNLDFGPASVKIRGSYNFKITMVDAAGNGWLIKAHFTVTR